MYEKCFETTLKWRRAGCAYAVDLSKAFLQIGIAEPEQRSFLTIKIGQSLHELNRLLFGLSISPRGLCEILTEILKWLAPTRQVGRRFSGTTILTSYQTIWSRSNLKIFFRVSKFLLLLTVLLTRDWYSSDSWTVKNCSLVVCNLDPTNSPILPANWKAILFVHLCGVVRVISVLTTLNSASTLFHIHEAPNNLVGVAFQAFRPLSK